MADAKNEVDQVPSHIRDVYEALGIANAGWTYADRPEPVRREKPAPSFQVVLSQNSYPPARR